MWDAPPDTATKPSLTSVSVWGIRGQGSGIHATIVSCHVDLRTRGVRSGREAAPFLPKYLVLEQTCSSGETYLSWIFLP